jgi:hypothetical protein|tara:strand:+ start:1217 stop:1639 length:423 start_codon:yes stop_codon:yes gene_type:complete
MPFTSIEEINNNPIYNPPASWVTDPLPYLKDINKVGRWTESNFSETYKLELPLDSYMWFKFKCLRNKTGTCRKTFYKDEYSYNMFTTYKDLKEYYKKHYLDTKPNYDLTLHKKSIHYNLELDKLYIGGNGFTAIEITVKN